MVKTRKTADRPIFESHGSADILKWFHVQQAIEAQAQAFPDKIAVIDLPDADIASEPRVMTYGELNEAIVSLANGLREIGLRQSDPVLFIAPPGLAALASFWATMLAGIVVPVNPFLSDSAIADIARSSEAKAIITAGSKAACGTWELGKRVKAIAGCIKFHLSIDPEDVSDGISLAKLASKAERLRYVGATPALNDIGAGFPTGGTTGSPKIARLTHRNILTGIASGAAFSSADHDHVVPLGLPLFHVGGALIVATRTVMLGQTLVILGPAGFRTPGLNHNFWKLADKYGFTELTAVPTIFSDLIRTHNGERTTIRHFIAGASKLPAALCDAFEERFGHGIHEGYGMTECAGFCTFNPLDRRPRAGSGGITSPFYDVRVVKLLENGEYIRDCSVGETGQIAVSGDAVFAGYFDSSQDSGKFIRGMGSRTWMDAGDLGYMDNEGYLWIKGRHKDLIIRGGHNIDPQAVEELLVTHPSVFDAAAVGMPDRRVGELPVAFVQLHHGHDLDEAALREFCASSLPEKAATPVRFFRLNELPRTAMRKIFKPELRRLAVAKAVEIGLSTIQSSEDLQWVAVIDHLGCIKIELSCKGASASTLKEAKNFIESIGIELTTKETING